MEVIGQLESQRRVVDFAPLHLVYILLGGHLIGVCTVVGNPAARHNTAQVQPLAELFAGVVKAATQAHVAVVGMHEYLDAVEPVTLVGVGIEGVVAGDFVKGMVIAKVGVLDPNGQRAGHYFIVDFHAELPFGKNIDQFIDQVLLPIVAADATVGLNHGLFQIGVITFFEIPAYNAH